MACVNFSTPDGLVAVHVCFSDHIVDLTPYGSRVWMEFDNRFGPSFYLGRESTVKIDNPSRKTWNAFEAWHREVIGK